MVIPEKARPRVEEIVRDNISRKTPLKLDEVLVGYDIRPGGTGKLDVKYLVVPSAVLERHLARLALTRAHLSEIEGAANADSPAVRIALEEKLRAGASRVSRLAAALIAVAVVSTSVGYGSTSSRQSAALRVLDEQLATLSSRVRQSTSEARTVRDLADGIQSFNEDRVAPGIVHVWEELARLLPDTAYLTDIEIKGAEVQLAGYADAPAQLIAVLESSLLLSDATFAGPVVRDQNRGKDHFSIRANLRNSRFSSKENE
jgi:general secretion pathway protein L